MGGPWFTVQKSANDWNEIGTLWLSNGIRDGKARLEYRVRFDRFDDSRRPSK